NYQQTEKWNQKNYDQTEYWNSANYQQTESWNLKNYQQTDHWNQKNFDQTEKWNWKNFNQTEYWNKRNEQMQYNMANFNYDMQEYFTERQERADLVMALSGTRSSSNSEVEGSTKGGSKINSKEDSVYNSHSHSVIVKASTKEDSVSDSISNLLSNTYTVDNGWEEQDTESNTETNGRTFGNSYSNSIMNELSIEEAKTISNETIYSKIESNSVSYQIRQSISDQPNDDGCYSYEVTPNIVLELILMKYLINLKFLKEKVQMKLKKKKEIEQYSKFQGKYHTLYFDFSSELYKRNNLNDFLDSINKILKEDIKKIYPKSNILNNNEKDKIDNLIYNLQYLHIESKDIFIIIIDEWDYLISNNVFPPEEKVEYIRFLKGLIKDKGYLAFAYMTGITPIAKEFSQSTLNCFTEYSMLKDKKYYQYFGFTEQEVRDLCEKNKKINKNSEIKYEKLENWYNGYKAYNGEKIFNPWSVYHALADDRIENYWNGTGRFDELVNIINFNILGVKDDILELIKGNKIKLKLKGFGTENNLNSSTNNKETNEKKKEKN
ncbi:hypothetical protein BCR32DRAFT_307150, partial [Anaeromyces robustus]